MTELPTFTYSSAGVAVRIDVERSVLGRWFVFSRDGVEVARLERPSEVAWTEVALPDAQREVVAGLQMLPDGETGVEIFVDGVSLVTGRAIEVARSSTIPKPHEDRFAKETQELLHPSGLLRLQLGLWPFLTAGIWAFAGIYLGKGPFQVVLAGVMSIAGFSLMVGFEAGARRLILWFAERPKWPSLVRLLILLAYLVSGFWVIWFGVLVVVQKLTGS